MKCPGCDKKMVEKFYEGVLIDQCPGCGGTWLDSGEITRIIDKKEETFRHKEKIDTFAEKGKDYGEGKKLHCPKCGEFMPVFQYMVNSGVFLNRCPDRHGLWLDKGELESVQILMEEYDQRFKSVEPNTLTAESHEVNYDSAIKGCPCCNEVLREAAYETELLDFCPKCGGVWCDGGELRKILESREKKFSPAQRKEISASENDALGVEEKDLIAEHECVLCSAPMRRINFSDTSGIVIDTCPHGHGVWLDRDELEAVQIFVEKWEAQRERVKSQYGQTLRQVRQSTSEKHKDSINNMRVSRFGVVNRMIRALARKGFFQ